MLFVTEGKPHLRLYANQNPDALASGKDFIAPQLIVGTENWEGAKPALERARTTLTNGAVELEIDVSGDGANRGMKLISEDPPGYNFGRALLLEYKEAHFIPGFRDGRPVSCSFRFTDYIFTGERMTRYSRLNPTHIGPQ